MERGQCRVFFSCWELEHCTADRAQGLFHSLLGLCACLVCFGLQGCFYTWKQQLC